jgi:hypothetical protein
VANNSKKKGNVVVFVASLLEVGQRIEVWRDIALLPDTTIKEGERGTVQEVDHNSGITYIRMDDPHEGLMAYDNCIWIVPPDLEVAGSIRQSQTSQATAPNQQSASLWWTVPIMAVIAPISLLIKLTAPFHVPSIALQLGIIGAAIFFGTRHAVIVALFSSVVYNLFVVPPLWEFSLPHADEYVRAGFYLGLALVIGRSTRQWRLARKMKATPWWGRLNAISLSWRTCIPDLRIFQ